MGRGRAQRRGALILTGARLPALQKVGPAVAPTREEVDKRCFFFPWRTVPSSSPKCDARPPCSRQQAWVQSSLVPGLLEKSLPLPSL